MISDLVFHIGDPKTGTTSIQDVLASGKWRAEGVKILYTAPINHLPLSRTLYDPKDVQHRTRRWQDVAQAASASTADHAVVSSELFEHVAPAALQAAIAEFLPDFADSARVVCYVRPHADRVISAYAERIKQGFTTDSLDDMYARSKSRGVFHYAPRFRAWREVFGDRFLLRPFVPDLLQGRDVVRDFLNIVLRGGPFELVGEGTRNPSLCVEDLAMLREFHLLMRGRKRLGLAGRAVGWNFADMLSRTARPGGTRLRLHAAVARDAAATYLEDAQALDAEFFGGQPVMVPALQAAVDRATPEAQSVEADKVLPPDELRQVRLWSQLAARLAAGSPKSIGQHFRQQKIAELAGERTQRHGAEGLPRRAKTAMAAQQRGKGRKRRAAEGGTP